MINKILKYFLKKKNSSLLALGQKVLSFSSRAFNPLHLNIEITRRCNLECFFCPSRFTKDERTDMTIGQFREALSKLPRLKVLTLLGRGETLINPDIFAMVDYALSKGIEAIDIVTNGTLFSEENIKKLEGVSNFTVSIDSPDPEEYRKLRGYSLSKIEENLQRLVKLAAWKPYVTVQMLVTSGNMRQMKDMLKWAKKIGASRCSFILMIAFDEKLDKTNPQFDKEFGNLVREAVSYAKETGIDIVAPSPVPAKKNCFEPWRSVRVDIAGDIYPCCYIFESDRAWTEFYDGVCLTVNQREYVMGNIFKDDFAGIWNGPGYRMLRSKVRNNNRLAAVAAGKFSQLRDKQAAGKKMRFSYCDSCLYRWQCAC